MLVSNLAKAFSWNLLHPYDVAHMHTGYTGSEMKWLNLNLKAPCLVKAAKLHLKPFIHALNEKKVVTTVRVPVTSNVVRPWRQNAWHDQQC